ncbi:hypothetical protein RhiJN_14304 [Ceratobasidium sp. AG-Ba]|nr:hypothetical protein RhiJN_14304 [Ceratobasidium sp. AG-Ba]QRW14854.1 hypothetical protein RhiLY_13853 [Ceratobasidium sp. AG-Ba]
MAGTKRTAESTTASPRAAKSAKVNSKDAATSKKPASKTSEKPASKAKAAEKPASKAKAPTSKSKAAPKSAGKVKTKATLSAEDFKAKALPIHLNLTHTPPKLAESTEESETPAEPSSSDPGFIASIPMQPTVFSTGSYGWKGSRRLTIPVGTDGETVTVMININAAVAGSKDASATAEKEDLAAAIKEDLASGSDSD